MSSLERTAESEFHRQGNCDEHVRIDKAVLDGDAEAAYERMKQRMLQLEIRYWR